MNNLRASYFLSNYKLYSFLILFIIFLLVFTQVLGFDGLYGQDSYEYLRYSEALENFLKSGEESGDYFWPLYYPLLGSLVNFAIDNMIFSLKIISTLSYYIIVIYIFKSILLLYRETKHLHYYILICVIFSPILLITGFLIMSDMLALCFITVAIFNFLRFHIYGKTIHLYSLAVFAVMAIMTRYASTVVFIPILFSVGITVIKNKYLLKHVIPIFAVMIILTTPHLYIRNGSIVSFLNHDWLSGWSFSNFFKSSFETVDGISSFRFKNIIYAFSNLFHPKFLVIGFILFLVGIVKRRMLYLNKTLFSSYLLYSLFLAGIPYQNNRFLILNFGITLVLAYPTFEFLFTFFSQKKVRNSLLIILLLIQSSLCYATFQPFFNRNQLEREISKAIASYQQNTLYSFDMDIALKGRKLHFNYKNLLSSKYEKYNSKDLLLFNVEKFENQWKGKNVMLNWHYINENFTLEVLEELPEGWKLYQIKQ